MSIVTKAEAVTGAWWAVIPIWAYACLALLAVSVIQTWRLGDAKRYEATLKASVATFESTQKTNLADIASLQASNDKWSKNAAVIQAQASKDDQTNVVRQAFDLTKLTSFDQQVKVIYAKQPASVQACTNLAVPADVTSRLRTLASGYSDAN